MIKQFVRAGAETPRGDNLVAIRRVPREGDPQNRVYRRLDHLRLRHRGKRPEAAFHARDRKFLRRVRVACGPRAECRFPRRRQSDVLRPFQAGRARVRRRLPPVAGTGENQRRGTRRIPFRPAGGRDRRARPHRLRLRDRLRGGHGENHEPFPEDQDQPAHRAGGHRLGPDRRTRLPHRREQGKPETVPHLPRDGPEPRGRLRHGDLRRHPGLRHRPSQPRRARQENRQRARRPGPPRRRPSRRRTGPSPRRRAGWSAGA